MLFKDIYSRRENNEALYSHECLQEKEKRCLVDFWNKYFLINKGEVFNASTTLSEVSVGNEVCYGSR